jgi:hypothetical protein
MTLPLQGKYRPQEYADVIGNHDAIETILSHVLDNGGSYMGLAFGLLGASGQGKGMISKTMIAHYESLIRETLQVVKASTNSPADFVEKLEQWKKECCTQGAMFGGMQTYTVFIFDEFNAVNNQSAWAAFKQIYDDIEDHRLAGKPCRAFAIFTTAKVRIEDQTEGFKREWTETTRRMKKVKTGVDVKEFNEYFAGVTGGLIKDMAFQIQSRTFTGAWNYIVEKQIDTVDYFPKQDFSELLDKIAAMQPHAKKKRLLGFAKSTPKKQQGLVGIITDIVKSAGTPVSYAAIRSELDESGRYVFKRGVDGWRRTNQITATVHNHIKKCGERALLQKTEDGRIIAR